MASLKTRNQSTEKPAKTLLRLRVNGEAKAIATEINKTLLEVLREDLGLNGTKHGCELGECGTCAVLVDGAHAFAQFDFKIPDLQCDYYAASLHKWLGCPLGTGILFVRRDRIAPLWPIYGDWRMTDDADINLEAIEVLVHRLRKKLADTGVQIVTMRGMGYCLENAVDNP